MMSKKNIAVALCSLVVLGSTAHAQEAEFITKEDWRAQVTPYVWAPSLRADLKPLRMAPLVHTKQSFSDVFSNLRLAAFLSGSVRYKNVVLLADYTYASSAKKEEVPLTHLRAKVKQSSLTLTGGYTFRPTEHSAVDLTAGVRHWAITSQVDVEALPYQWKAKMRFYDPIVSVRWLSRITPHWSTLLYTDVGVGKRTTHQVLAAVNYRLSDRFYASLGYRQVKVDYKHQGKRANITMRGPVVGVTYAF